MRYDLTIIHALDADDDIDARKQAETVLRAIALLARHDVITFSKIGLQLLRQDGSEVDLPEPQFPKGQRVPQEDI